MSIRSRTVGVDLGTRDDFTAVAVLDEVDGVPSADSGWPSPTYAIRWMRRRRGVPYTAIIDELAAMAAWPALAGSRFVVDATGVGRPVVDALRQRVPRVHAVVITGGVNVTTEGPHESHVPKQDLIASVQMLLQGGRLTVDSGLDDAQALRDELLDFGYQISESGRTTMEAASGHDDLVLSVSLACWAAQRPGQGAAFMEAWRRLAGRP